MMVLVNDNDEHERNEMDYVEMALNFEILAFKWNNGLQNNFSMGLIFYPSAFWGKNIIVGA